MLLGDVESIKIPKSSFNEAEKVLVAVIYEGRDQPTG